MSDLVSQNGPGAPGVSDASPSLATGESPGASGGVRTRANIEVVIPTFNEELNLAHALNSVVGWADAVWVVDSESTDRTRAIAEDLGARVVIRPWLGYAKQKNWALENLPIESDWVFILDADESISPELREELLEIARSPVEEVRESGFYVNRLTYFMGKAIRHCGYFPSYNLRFFKHGRAWYEDRDVHEHMVVSGSTRRLRHLMRHEDRRGLEHFIAKHNRYSTLEAREQMRERVRVRKDRAKELERGIALRRFLKHHVQPRLPFAGLWRFVYMYFLRAGFLDGINGLRFCLFLATYDFFISLKLQELKQRGALVNSAVIEAAATQGLAVPEGANATPSGKASDHYAATRAAGSAPAVERRDASRVRHQLTPDPGTHLGQMTPESSPWTTREKLARAVWMVAGKPVFRLSFHNWYGFRAALLRLFGARIGRDVRIRPSAHIEIPWHVTIGDDVTIGDHAILYSLGHITIGARTIVSQYAHLCAGTHDYTDRRFPLLRLPIEVGEDAWICADTFVGPNVKIGKLTVLGARSSTYKSLEAGWVYSGNPAKALKQRELR
ncbi:MAG: WcaF family extracellular polysaccharide biosynthesis acetyltransferase [Phycisphaeraceae bacterium]|nr:WcaF family extracellular polysaccharide biosynthesis acetyltransferase [Phycisphaeraceae bacterium]